MFPQRSILVATDLTEECEPALRIASDLALGSGASLHVLHAFELHGNPYVTRAAARNAFQALLQEARDGLDQQVALTVAAGVDLKSVTSELYLPWKAIVQRAKDVQAELIVLGPHEPVAGDRFLGATADRVVRFAEAPILIVRRGRRFAAACIVLAIDGSPATSAAWQEAIWWTAEVGRTTSCQLHIVTVSSNWTDAMGDQELIDGAISDARARLGSSQVSVTGELLHGDDAASEIISYGNRIGADLLIIGSSGHGNIDRVITGSTTSSVALRSSCPVLVVPVKSSQAVNEKELLSWHLPMALL
jgi:nucleotide-binding universal stress UspA family protein